jgi:hypothetical protein
MRATSGDTETLRRENYVEIAHAMASQIVALTQMAKEGKYALPIELLITDADDSLVCQAELSTGGILQDLSHSHTLLKARFPVTATLTDKNGVRWETTFTRPTLQ